MRHRPTLIAVLLLLLMVSGCVTAGPGDPFHADNSSLGLDERLRLANAALRGGNTDSAIAMLRQAVGASPDSVTAKRALADSFYAIGAFPEAEQAYTELGILDGGIDESRVGLARVALSQGDLRLALERYEAARSVQPDDARVMNGLAVTYDLIGRHDDAQAIYTGLLARDPANRAVANNRALSLALAGNTTSAIAQLAALVSGPADIPQAKHNLALVFGLAGNEDASRAVLDGELPRASIDDNIGFYRLARGVGAPIPTGVP